MHLIRMFKPIFHTNTCLSLVLIKVLNLIATLSALAVESIELEQESILAKSSNSTEQQVAAESTLKNVTYNSIFIFMCIVYTISTLSAIFTNLIVLIVYIFGQRSKTELSNFLINLAIADFLMSTFCMPFTFAQALLNRWIFGEIMCPIVLFKQVFTVSLSIYTMVAIGIDRYYAIKSPLKNRVTHKKSKFAISGVWIISFCLASVQLFVARTQESFATAAAAAADINATSFYSNSTASSPTSKTVTCNEVWSSNENRQRYTLFNFFAVYLIPVFILGYTYARIAFIIKQTTHPGNADASRDQNYTKSKNKVVKMLILLVCVFTICWLPLHVFNLIYDFTNWLHHMPSSLWFFYSAHWLAMANCTINPIIYGYSTKNFRSDVYALILCCRCMARREWMRQESSKTTSLFKRTPRGGSRMSSHNNNLSVNTSFLKQKENVSIIKSSCKSSLRVSNNERSIANKNRRLLTAK